MATKNIERLIKRTIIESIEEVLADPDAGLELNKNIARRLARYSRSKTARGVPITQLRRKYS